MWVRVGRHADNGADLTAAVVHLARIGSGANQPWEVVGTRDETLSLDEWIRPAIICAQVYDFLGLSGEALETYRSVARRDPHNMPARVHLFTIEALLRDPTLPDSTRLPARLLVP